ncbi:MAG: GTP-binding protein [Promethearchaeota archaeon]
MGDIDPLERLKRLVENGENKRTEFKRFLKEKDLKPDRRQKLQTQLRYISNVGPAGGTFAIGIEDIRGEMWELYPLSGEEYKVSKSVLKKLCDPIDLEIVEEEKVEVEGGFVGVFKVGPKPLQEVQEEITINVLGRVNAGKSTLIGVLLSGNPDDGSGLARARMLVHPQELRRGQTADLHITFLGLDEGGKRISPELGPDFRHQERVITEAARLLIFYDAPGHQEYSRTMLRSVLGGHAQYGLFLVPVRDEVKLVKAEEQRSGLVRLDPISREQLILVSQANVPFFVVLNKVDRADREELTFLRGILKTTLKEIGKVPFLVKDEKDVSIAMQELSHHVIVPILEVSCVTMKGVDLLFEFLRRIPVTTDLVKYDVPAIAYIDKIYRGIRGTNLVTTGTVLEGLFKPGQKVKVFPSDTGGAFEGRLDSIEVFHKRVERVKAGEVYGFDIHKVPKEKVRRGQVIVDYDFPLTPVREFEAKIVVTYHSVRIKKGYTPVLQAHTINQAVTFEGIEGKDFLSLGDVANVRLRFLKHPEFLRVGDKVILREGNMRGFGTVTRVFTEESGGE